MVVRSPSKWYVAIRIFVETEAALHLSGQFSLHGRNRVAGTGVVKWENLKRTVSRRLPEKNPSYSCRKPIEDIFKSGNAGYTRTEVVHSSDIFDLKINYVDKTGRHINIFIDYLRVSYLVAILIVHMAISLLPYNHLKHILFKHWRVVFVHERDICVYISIKYSRFTDFASVQLVWG